jgi:molybdopterin converting factor small subunit
MKTVTVHYFAGLRERKLCEQECVELMANESVAQLYDRLFPGPVETKLPVGFAVNQSYAPGTTLLKTGDEVAFIPPIGGG